MRFMTLPGGEKVPSLGLGTWHMGERASERANEIRALRLGIDQGLGLIDTAEMYGDGGAEQVVGAAIAGHRDRIFLVSKVYPHNASRLKAIEACERSLGRLRCECLDLYLLHWRGSVPLAETIEAFERLKSDGKIRHWGVSNFDADDMDELLMLAPPDACATNQVLYHLGERGIEWDLLPACRDRGIAVMAYSPLGQGAILRDPLLEDIGARHGASPATVALAWVLRREGVIAIPKAVDPDHLRANRAALDLQLDADDFAQLDAAFPGPSGSSPLAII